MIALAKLHYGDNPAKMIPQDSITRASDHGNTRAKLNRVESLRSIPPGGNPCRRRPALPHGVHSEILAIFLVWKFSGLRFFSCQ